MSKFSYSIENESVESRFLKLESIIGSLRYSLRVANEKIDYLMSRMKILGFNDAPEEYNPKHIQLHDGPAAAVSSDNVIFNPLAVQKDHHPDHDSDKVYVKVSKLCNRRTGASLNRALIARRRLEPFEKIIYYIGTIY